MAERGRQLKFSNLPSDIDDTYLTLFLEQKDLCPAGGNVEHVDFNAVDATAVVTFMETSGKQRLKFMRSF
jgi:hypothetical protein